MDIQTAKQVYSMLNPKAYLNEQEQSLLDAAEAVLEEAGLIDKNGAIEDKEHAIQAYSKTTVGFVTQRYIMNKEGKYICIEQFFTAGDQIDRENKDGNSVEIDVTKEVYQEFNMEQPQ